MLVAGPRFYITRCLVSLNGLGISLLVQSLVEYRFSDRSSREQFMIVFLKRISTNFSLKIVSFQPQTTTERRCHEKQPIEAAQGATQCRIGFVSIAVAIRAKYP